MGDADDIIPQRGESNSALLNAIISRYFLRKHSWHGKYNRAFCLTPGAVMTLNPATLEVTNSWDVKDIVGATPDPKAEDEFAFSFRKPNGKPDKMTFSTVNRAHLLCDLLQILHKARGHTEAVKTFQAKKLKRSGERKDVTLALYPWALCQVNPITGAPMATYYYHYIEKLLPVSDIPGGFVLFYGKLDKRLYMFMCDQREDLLSVVQLTAASSLGVRLNQTLQGGPAPPPVTRDYVVQLLEAMEDDSVFNTVGKFNVLKHTAARHTEPAPRILTLSDKWLVERNPTTYAVVTMRPLLSVSFIVRPPDDPQAFSVHYRDGTFGSYSSSSRESLLACLIDCTRATGNKDALVLAQQLRRGLRMTPIGVPTDANMEAQIVKALSAYLPEAHAGDDAYLGMLVEMFNANVPYSGPQHVEANRQPKICVQAYMNLLSNFGSQRKQVSIQVVHAMRRLISVRTVFESFSDNLALRDRTLCALAECLASPDDLMVLAALEVTASLMVPLFELPPPPPGVPADAPTASRTTDDSNKRIILGHAPLMSAFMTMFTQHVKRGTSPLVIAGCIDILTYSLCQPYSDSTDAKQFDALLEQVAGLGRELFKLFHEQHCLSVIRGAGMLMKAIIEEGGEIKDMVPKMQLSALVEGATLRHLHSAFFTKCATQRQAMFKELSSKLVTLWVSGCPEAERMLTRALPPALAGYLDSTEAPPAESQQQLQQPGSPSGALGAKVGTTTAVVNVWEQWRSYQYPKRAPLNPRPRRADKWTGAGRNWPMLFFQVKQDHARADLVWNNHTREELREALENELRTFRQEQELASGGSFISWNHSEFIVPYECLTKELNVGGYYIRLLLNPPAPGAKAPPLHNPAEFFDMLFHRCLLERDGDLVALCVQALTVVYKYYTKAVGPFRDVAHVIEMLRRATNRLIRDRLLQFVYVLLAVEDNAKRFIDCGGVALLVDLLTLVHFNFDHIVAPVASNLITAGANRLEGEWYYTVVTPSGEKLEDGSDAPPKKERFGPKNLVEMRELFAAGVLTASTLVWAQGMEDWRPLQDVVQLRWALMATGGAVLNSVDLASLLLDMLYKLCKLYPIRDADGGIIRPVPRPKRQLSSPALLPHICQLFLTFQPVLVEKTAALLSILLEDNAAALPKLYLTGVYFFAIVYGGSNVLSLVNFLHSTHLQQHFREEEAIGDLPKRSILGPLFPAAMIYHMERHTTEEFSQVFLGNYDTPEAIWNSDMRRFMIDKVATHLGNFPTRLNVNPKAVYQYVPIAPIVYKQLEHELFCYRFYLRNFCDEAKFPDWPVDNEVEFLQSALSGWAKESDSSANAPAMSEEEACKTLNIKPGYRDDELRRAYFKLAREYHPDKNPEGRHIFEKLHEAYNILTQNNGALQSKNKAELLMKVQVIIYRRFKKQLSPFKYAGYTLLINTLQTALTADDRPTLNMTTELCYRTILSSKLNVEELRRQSGLEMMASALARCVELIMPDSKETDDVVVGASNTLRMFATAAAFEQCRVRIVEGLPGVVQNVIRCLRTTALPRIVESALECICCFALDAKLQAMMHQLYLIHLLVPRLFKYDYTLESVAEGGVETTQQNTQHHLNTHASLAMMAISRCAGGDPAIIPDQMVALCTRALISNGMADLFGKRQTSQMLKDLNSNIETPLLLWNAACRGEVLSYIERKLPSFGPALSDGIDGTDDDSGPNAAREFVFETLACELQIGGVYVRLFNEQIRSHNTLPDPKRFCKELVNYLAHSVPPKEPVPREDGTIDAEYVASELERLWGFAQMAAEALRNLLRANAGLEAVLANKADAGAVVSVLGPSCEAGHVGLTRAILESVALLTKNNDCLDAIGDSGCMGHLFPALHIAPGGAPTIELANSVISSMFGNSKLVASAISQGGLLYLLKVFASPTERGAEIAPRVQAAMAIAKLSADLAHGSRVHITFGRIAPATFLASMRQDSEAAVHMFEATHENPELIWNQNTRAQLREALGRMSAEYYERQKKNRGEKWILPDDFRVEYAELKGEPIIGGIYTRLFLAQPTWALRNPKEFAEAVLTKYVELYNQVAKDGGSNTAEEQLRYVASVATAFFTANPAICDHAAKTGHLTKMISQLDNSALPRKHPSCVVIIAILLSSQLCVEAAATVPTAVRALTGSAMQCAPGAAVQALERMFTKNVCRESVCLVAQIGGTPQGLEDMMGVLEGRHDFNLGADASEVKARLVSGLQAACSDALHGEPLRLQLSQNKVWANFSGQRHDLFLPAAAPVAGLLTGPTSGGAAIGLLTNTPHNASVMPDAPPEL